MDHEKIIELQRKDLEEQLEEIMRRQMMMIVAPAGYGKTTLLYRFFDRHPEVDAIWFSMGENETDDEWLWQKICHQFRHIDEQVYDKLKNIGLPRSGQNMELLFQIIVEYLNGPLCLVIDDYQECRSKAIHKLLSRLGQAGIPNLHLVIIGRVYPEFLYEEMMLKGNCGMIDQQALTISRDEIAEIYSINGVKLQEEELEELAEYTDGWIAAVYLTLLDYKRLGYFRVSMSMMNLLKTAIFDKFPEQLRAALAKMSLFDAFTLEELCYVMEADLEKMWLQSMMENIGFSHYSVKEGKYIIHSLLRSVAREELEKTGADKDGLYRRDGEWQEKNGNRIEAIIDYRKCGETERIFRILSDTDSMELYNGAPQLFEEFYRAQPLEARLLHPIAYLSYIYFVSVQCNVDAGNRLFREAYDGYAVFKEKGFTCKEIISYRDTTPWDCDRIWGELYIIKSLLEFNDLDKMTECMRKASCLLKDRPSVIFEKSLLTYGTPYTLHLYHRTAGRLKDVVEKEKEYTRYFMKLIQRVDGGWDELYDAEYALTVWDVEKALELAEIVSEKARFRKQICVIISSYGIKLRSYIYLGRVQEFEKALNELKEQMKEITRSVFIVDYELAYGSAFARIGRLDKIPEWLYNFNLDECNQIIRSVRSGCMTYGIILRQEKQWIKLDALAEQMLLPYKNSVHLYVIISAYCYKAIAAAHLESREKGTEWLKKAVDIAVGDSIKSPFIENAQELLPLLQKMAENNAFCRELVPSCEKWVESCKKFKQKPDEIRLTEREQEIMMLVKKGKHNTEIGEELHIALVTVEKTLTNIYRKLGVSNRAAAVAKFGGGGE